MQEILYAASYHVCLLSIVLDKTVLQNENYFSAPPATVRICSKTPNFVITFNHL
jgi:hypothetical protein